MQVGVLFCPRKKHPLTGTGPLSLRQLLIASCPFFHRESPTLYQSGEIMADLFAPESVDTQCPLLSVFCLSHPAENDPDGRGLKKLWAKLTRFKAWLLLITSAVTGHSLIGCKYLMPRPAAAHQGRPLDTVVSGSCNFDDLRWTPRPFARRQDGRCLRLRPIQAHHHVDQIIRCRQPVAFFVCAG